MTPRFCGAFLCAFCVYGTGDISETSKKRCERHHFEYFLKIRRKRLNICADLCYTYNVVYSASEEYILADSGNNIVNNTP